MREIMEVLRQCVQLSVLVSILQLLMGQSELKKYFSFFVGVLFLMLVFSPLFQFLGKTEDMLGLCFDSIKEQYREQKDFSTVLGKYGKTADAEATRILVEGFQKALADKDYEIYEHEAVYSEGRLKKVTLFIRMKKDGGEVTERRAEDCRKTVIRDFSPDFTVMVVGGQRESEDF